MPKVTYTSQRGLIQETGSEDVNLSGQGVLSGQLREVITAATTTNLTADQSGALVLLAVGSNAATTINLPSLSASLIGVWYEFAHTVLNTGAYTIKRGNEGTDVLIGGLFGASDAASNSGANANGKFIAPGGSDDTITIDDGGTESDAALGTNFKVIAVSATQWYVEGQFLTDTEANTLANIFSNT